MKNLALVGLGMMGGNHLRTMLAEQTVNVVAVVEPDQSRCELPRANGIADFESVEKLLNATSLIDELDGVVIATPTLHHCKAAIACLNAGLGVLVEKPIASTIEEATKMIEAARDYEQVLIPGHVERFNPVVRELLKQSSLPLHISSRRIGGFSPRVGDGVVIDLMIHDLDIVRSLAGSDLVDAKTISRHDKAVGSEDYAATLLRFQNGVTASLTASRLGQQKIRDYEVTFEDRVITADLITQNLSVFSVNRTEFVSDQGVSYKQSTSVEIPFIEQRGEPLTAQLRNFLDALDGKGSAMTAEDGLIALDLVNKVLEDD